MKSEIPTSPAPQFLDVRGIPPISYRPWGTSGSKTPVIMLHGLESHSGWFAQSAAWMAGLGHPVYAMDRRGSGASTAPRGVCNDYRDLLEEIGEFADFVVSENGCEQFQLLGHCFGAIPAVAFACQQPGKIASLILATPAIYTLAEPVMRDKLKILWAVMGGRNNQIPVSLQPELFTKEVQFLNFIESDPLALRTVSARIYWEILRARRFIHAQERQLTMPVLMALAGEDKICDNLKDQAFFERITSPEKSCRVYPEAVHILEFSSERDAFFNDLSGWLAR